MTDEPKQVVVTIAGDVQGVGFRQWFAAQAKDIGLSGWVRNRLNGQVEAEVTGSTQQIEQLISACKQGPSAAKVKTVDYRQTLRVDIDWEGIKILKDK